LLAEAEFQSVDTSSWPGNPSAFAQDNTLYSGLASTEYQYLSQTPLVLDMPYLEPNLDGSRSLVKPKMSPVIYEPAPSSLLSSTPLDTLSPLSVQEISARLPDDNLAETQDNQPNPHGQSTGLTLGLSSDNSSPDDYIRELEHMYSRLIQINSQLASEIICLRNNAKTLQQRQLLLLSTLDTAPDFALPI
jgi:hypothetical protein